MSGYRNHEKLKAKALLQQSMSVEHHPSEDLVSKFLSFFLHSVNVVDPINVSSLQTDNIDFFNVLSKVGFKSNDPMNDKVREIRLANQFRADSLSFEMEDYGNIYLDDDFINLCIDFEPEDLFAIKGYKIEDDAYLDSSPCINHLIKKHQLPINQTQLEIIKNTQRMKTLKPEEICSIFSDLSFSNRFRLSEAIALYKLSLEKGFKSEVKFAFDPWLNDQFYFSFKDAGVTILEKKGNELKFIKDYSFCDFLKTTAYNHCRQYEIFFKEKALYYKNYEKFKSNARIYLKFYLDSVYRMKTSLDQLNEHEINKFVNLAVFLIFSEHYYGFERHNFNFFVQKCFSIPDLLGFTIKNIFMIKNFNLNIVYGLDRFCETRIVTNKEFQLDMGVYYSIIKWLKEISAFKFFLFEYDISELTRKIFFLEIIKLQKYIRKFNSQNISNIKNLVVNEKGEILFYEFFNDEFILV